MLQTGGIEQGGQQAWPVPPVWRDRRPEGRVPDDGPLPGRPGSGALSRYLAGWGRPLPQGGYTPQSRQSARLFLQSSELGLPQPLTRRRVCSPPHPLVPGGGAHSPWRERGWESPNSNEGTYTTCAQPTVRPSSLLRSCTRPCLQCCCGSGPGSERFSRRVRICPFLI